MRTHRVLVLAMLLLGAAGPAPRTTKILAGAMLPTLAGAGSVSGRMGLDERISAQRAIEQVLWSHRIWPEGTPGPKPALSEVLPDRMLRAKVEDYLRKSNALEAWLRRPITAGDLQAEMDRMAAGTHDRRMLRELFVALGNDPFVIAETLARQTLVERLIRSWHAEAFGAPSFDDWWTPEGGTLAAAVVEQSSTFTLPATDSTGCVADTWTSIGGLPPTARANHTAVWTGAEMIVWGGGTNTGGRYNPATDDWLPTATGENVPAERSGHTAVWTGREMIVWGGGTNTGGRYNPATDDWLPTATGENVPAERSGHTAVWTGREMIVWGGGLLNSGGRYNPITDTWTPTTTGENVPSGRSGHTAVWTGTEMIVWGGNQDGPLQSGGRYDPEADRWTPTSTGAGLPGALYGHTAVWTGREMIVLGFGFPRGGRYDPSLDAWTSMDTTLFTTENNQSAVWTGWEMIVWGGTGFFCDTTEWHVSSGTRPPRPEECYGYYVDGGWRYDPAGDSWSPVAWIDRPVARVHHTAVWTGTEMIVWGGWEYGGLLDTGGRYCACPDGALSYRDSDGDGYGDPTSSRSSCDGTIPAGHVRDGGDCDDTSASVSPGAAESCNRVDDDCDGGVDEGFDLGDPDGDGVETCRDTCPEIANPDQNLCACALCAPFEIAIAFGGDPAKGAGVVTWTTDLEHDVRGFNIVVFDTRGGRIQQNLALIPCLECITDRGASYSFLIPRHRGGRNVFVEQVHLDGQAGLFGPAEQRPHRP